MLIWRYLLSIFLKLALMCPESKGYNIFPIHCLIDTFEYYDDSPVLKGPISIERELLLLASVLHQFLPS